MDKSTAAAHGPGLIAGVTGLVKNAYGLVVSRMELAALELSEVRNHLIELVALFAVAAICGVFALAFGSAIIVALAWEAMGWTILLVMFLVYAGLAVVLGMKGKAMLKEGKLSFPETMKEIQKDRQALL
jgi:uncharacterized membrane protein YqjE